MLRGETTKRSPLDAAAVVAALQAHGVEQLRGEPSGWVIVDGSDLRKPHASEMACLQRVKRLGGEGTVPGYPTLNVIGLGKQRRGLPYHKLSSSAAPDFLSAPLEARHAIRSVGGAPAAQAAAGCDITAIVDRGLDDQAVWGGAGPRAGRWSAASATTPGWSAPPPARPSDPWPRWRRGGARWRGSRPSWWSRRPGSRGRSCSR